MTVPRYFIIAVVTMIIGAGASQAVLPATTVNNQKNCLDRTLKAVEHATQFLPDLACEPIPAPVR